MADIRNLTSAGIAGKVGTSALNNIIDILMASKKVPSSASIATGLGKGAYDDLSKVQSFLAALSNYGIKKAKGKKTTLREENAKKPSFFDVVENIPSEYSAEDITSSLPGITGSLTPSEENKRKLGALWAKFKASGLNAALPPIARVVLEGGEKTIPIGQIQAGAGKALNIASKMTPLTRIGTALANMPSLQPKVDLNKKISPMDIIKPLVGFGMDTVTHPVTAIAGAGGLALKGIKAAAGPGAKLGQETFAAFGEAYPRVVQMFAEALKLKDPEKIYASLRSPSKILSPKLQESLMKAQRDIGQFGSMAESRVRAWADIKNPEARKAVGEAVLNNDYAKLDTFKESFPQIEKVAKDFRRLINKAGLQAVKAGKVSPETYLANKDTYARRMYEYFENHKEYIKNNPEKNLEQLMLEMPITGKGIKEQQNIFKKRVATPETQEKLGVLGPEQIGYTAGEGSLRTYRSARNAEMFQELSAAPDVVKPMLPENVLASFPGKNLAEKEINAVRQADKIKVNIFTDIPVVKIGEQQWAKMPSNKAYGAISNKWLPRFDAEHIIGTYAYKPQWLKTYDNLLNLWKSGKVVLSTAAQARNIGSNTILMAYSGIPVFDSVRYLKKSLGRLIEKGDNDYIQRAFIRFGGKGSQWADVESMKFGSKFTNKAVPSQFSMTVKDIANIPGKLYGDTESLFKNAVMRYWHEEKGLPLKEAFGKAQETLFNYGDVSKFIGGVKKTAIPFVTFFSKALPFTAKSALSRPMSVLPIIAVKDTLNNHTSKKLGLNDKDIKTIKQRYGDWYLITGGTKQKPEILDLSYIIPGLSDLTGGQGGRGILGETAIPQSLQPSSPLLTALEVLPGVNKSFYFNKPIWNESDLKLKEAVASIDMLEKQGVSRRDAIKRVFGSSRMGKTLLYALKNLSPANILMPGSYQWDQLKAALQGTPVYTSGEVPTLKSALQSAMGAKFSPLDLQKQNIINLRTNLSTQKEIRNELLKVNRSKLSPSEKELRRKLLMLQLKSQIEKLRSK